MPSDAAIRSSRTISPETISPGTLGDSPDGGEQGATRTSSGEASAGNSVRKFVPVDVEVIQIDLLQSFHHGLVRFRLVRV
jgi:hypothetical protein